MHPFGHLAARRVQAPKEKKEGEKKGGDQSQGTSTVGNYQPSGTSSRYYIHTINHYYWLCDWTWGGKEREKSQEKEALFRWILRDWLIPRKKGLFCMVFYTENPGKIYGKREKGKEEGSPTRKIPLSRASWDFIFLFSHRYGYKHYLTLWV